MSVLELRMDRKRCLGLNPDDVLQKLLKNFPEANVCPEDKLACQVQRAEQITGHAADNSNELIVQTLRRNAERNGPQYSFDLSFANGKAVKGYVQRYVIVFLYDDPLDDGTEKRLLDFLRSFGTGVVKKTTNNGQVEEP